jgi:outer membrane protein assembly factor BamD (BamD/ComL family)
MRHSRSALLLPAATLAPACAIFACASDPDRHTLAELRRVEPDVREARVEDSLDQAIQGYRSFLEQAPESSLTPEAMRRLADLKLEKEFGILGDGGPVELPAPKAAAATAQAGGEAPERPRAGGIVDRSESEQDFERRAAGATEMRASTASADLELPGGRRAAPEGPLEAIELYDRILASYPGYPYNDQVLYQKARAFDELGRSDEAIAVIERLIAEHPGSRHIDEVQFRRAEYFFTRGRFLDAEKSYAAITARGARSEYYELALYKLGWALYKQDLLEEALHEYVALLDHKVATGYDFDQQEDEDTERRIADTYRVISLIFSNLGGSQSLQDYFEANGARSYEDRIYSHLAEFYLEKLRYHDAAGAYQSFVALHPLHRSAPHFSMRVVEIYEKGDFPKLVLEARKEFASTYGLQSEYWRHFEVEKSPEVLSYLKANLEDLAQHYHALYQDAELAGEKPANFQEALRWYRAYLASFPKDVGAPATHHRLADLLLENQDFGEAAREYEHTAYGYPAHDRAAAAGYAAIYAHREAQKRASGAEQEAARREAVTSTLRFVDAFPAHEHAAAVLGAAADDLYEMKSFELAIATGRKLIDGYPEADGAIRSSAWKVVAHSSFDTGNFPQAEQAYSRVLELMPEADESRKAVTDNLAATIYKQGEQANAAEDPRAAAAHFLRVAQAAPSSQIRPLAEYDAGAALIRLQDWAGAAKVLDAFRESYPEHELNREATKQMAFVYREEGELARAAGEYARVAAESEDPELGRAALLEAGELYERSQTVDRALAVYLDYVSRFPEPIEANAETRFKLARMYEAARDELRRRDQLRQIVELDAAAGDGRTPRVRHLAAQSALVLAEDLYRAFAGVRLFQPFEDSLREKQERMNATLDALGRLVDYEVGEVTAAATFYMAEVYSDYSRSLVESERPTDLAPAELQDYESALEEDAFPFEEKAIAIHEKNLELLTSGVHNAWIDRSLARLASLMPGRYAKPETSSGWIASLDTWSYRTPTPPAPAPDPAQIAAPAATPPSDDPAATDAAEDTVQAPAAIDPAPELGAPEPTPAAADEGEGNDATR